MNHSTWCLFRVHKITTMSNHTYMTFKIFFFYIPNFVHQTQKQWDTKMDNKLKSGAQPEIVLFFYILALKDSLPRSILNLQDIDVVIMIQMKNLYDLWL